MGLGRLYAGGAFTSAGGVPANFVARWGGGGWSPLGSGVNLPVESLAVFEDGGGQALYVGGDFSIAGGLPASLVAKWSGSGWSSLGDGLQGNSVQALATFDDGSGRALYAGGRFSSGGGVAAHCIARWGGSDWSALGAGMDGAVRCLVAKSEDSGPALYVGGEFSTALDSGDAFLAKWQGCLDTTAPIITCPSLLLAIDAWGSIPGEIVNFQVTANDLCGAAMVLCIPASGSFFPRGITVVTCTATDLAGNQATCTFPVIVQPKIRLR